MMMAVEQALGKAQGVFESLNRTVRDAGEEGRRADEVERQLFEGLLELGRILMAAFFAQTGNGDVGETVERDGQRLHRLKGTSSRLYRSIFGVLRIVRCTYAVRKGQKAYAPLDEKLALPASEQSYVLEDWLQRFCVQNAFGESVRSLGDLLGTKTSKRTAERVNQELASFVEPFRESQSSKFNDDEDILVVSADGKGVNMRSTLESRHGLPEPAWRRCHQKKQEAKAGERAKSRLGRGQVKNRKQMAYVGAVYTIKRWTRTADDLIDELAKKKEEQQRRPTPKNKRVQAILTNYQEGRRQDGQPSLFANLAAQVAQRDPQGSKPLVCLMDGQRSLWQMQRRWLARAVCILDIFHVIERLWQAAYCFHREGSRAAEEMVNHYLKMILEGKVSSAIGSLRRRSAKLSQKKKDALEKILVYLRNNREYMQYDQYLQQGYPIGSGVVEGACRHLVKDRMERTGMRWEVEGAQAMLNTRSAYLNDEWDELIEYRIRQEQKSLYGQAA